MKRKYRMWRDKGVGEIIELEQIQDEHPVYGIPKECLDGMVRKEKVMEVFDNWKSNKVGWISLDDIKILRKAIENIGE